MMDFKKDRKDLYQPTTAPSVVDVPAMVFLAVDGAGDPNTSPAYAAAIETLYGLSYGIKMAHKHVLEYVVPPLEGFWTGEGASQSGVLDKDKLRWTAVIRQPDFVTAEVLDDAKATLAKRKPALDVASARLETLAEGLCVQILHVGSYDLEPASVAAMERFATAQGYAIDLAGQRRHHELYLSDPRKTAPEKLKTILRHPVTLAVI